MRRTTWIKSKINILDTINFSKNFSTIVCFPINMLLVVASNLSGRYLQSSTIELKKALGIVVEFRDLTAIKESISISRLGISRSKANNKPSLRALSLHDLFPCNATFLPFKKNIYILIQWLKPNCICTLFESLFDNKSLGTDFVH